MADHDYDKYKHELEFEHNLLNHRITWLLVSQTLLFAAYAQALSSPDRAFRTTLAVVGLAVCMLVFLGVVAALSAKVCGWYDVRKAPGHSAEPFGARTWITLLGAVPDFSLPLAFATAWGRLL